VKLTSGVEWGIANVVTVKTCDDPELIEEMHRKARDGFDVVCARRRNRDGETWIKKIVAWAGYKVINRIANVDIPANTGDFRIMSRRVIDELRHLPERHGFLRGLVALVGYKQGFVEYERAARFSGKGNYNRMLGSITIGLNGVIGFSSRPLTFVLFGGVVVAGISFILALVMVLLKLLSDHDYPMGIPTLTVLVLFIGGVQLISVGILGEYIGRIYDEVRRRPMYLIDEAINVTVRNSRGPESRSEP